MFYYTRSVNKTNKPLRKLHLELLPNAATRQWFGLLVLFVGVVLAMGVTVHYVQVQQKVAVIETDVNADPQAASNKNAAQPTVEEIQVVRSSIDQLAMPWGGLFTALESIDAAKVAVIAITPDAQNGTVKVVAEAQNAYEMLDCVRGLSLQPRLKNVLLQAYEVREDDVNQPMRFILTASWVQTP